MKNGTVNMGHVNTSTAVQLLTPGLLTQLRDNVNERLRTLSEQAASGVQTIHFDSSEELLQNDMLVLFENEVDREELVNAIKNLNSTPHFLTQALEGVEVGMIEFRESLEKLLRRSHGAETQTD